MSIFAYMLVETSVEPGEFARKAREVKGVKLAHALFGALDVIVVIEAADFEGLERTVWQVHEVPGLKSGDTRIARSG